MAIHIHLHLRDSGPEFDEKILSLWRKYSGRIDKNIPDGLINSLTRGAQSAEARFFNALVREIKSQGLNVPNTLAKLNKYY